MLNYLFLNPMVVPLELMRAAFDGTNPPIPDWAIYWSVSFSLISDCWINCFQEDRIKGGEEIMNSTTIRLIDVGLSFPSTELD